MAEAEESQVRRLYYETAISVAKEAGKVALEGYHGNKTMDTKESKADFVTETDRKVEKLIFSLLKKEYPDHCFIGEESSTECNLTKEPTWIVDPIDGTTNFIHKIPNVAISIALWIGKEAIVGIVYNFITNELYAALKNHGATLNGKPLQVSQCTDFECAIVIYEMGYDRTPDRVQTKLENFRKFFSEKESIRGVRCFGSAALDLCYVAAGIADAYYEFGIHCWDVAAGGLIVQEAGGTVLNTRGEDLDIMKREILCASSPQLALKLTEKIKKVDYPPDNL